jgi:hypothetical protein
VDISRREHVLQAALTGCVEELNRRDDPVVRSVKEHLEYLLGLVRGAHQDASCIKRPAEYSYATRDLADLNPELATLVGLAWFEADAMWFEYHPRGKPTRPDPSGSGGR